MNSKCFLYLVGFFFIQFSIFSYADHCPDPQTTSLKWGIPPLPWELNPYSPNTPQPDDNIRFVRANILIAGYGRGVMCTYETFAGQYSIWWQIITKIPSRNERYWIDTLGGMVCVQSLQDCDFYTAY